MDRDASTKVAAELAMVRLNGELQKLDASAGPLKNLVATSETRKDFVGCGGAVLILTSCFLFMYCVANLYDGIRVIHIASGMLGLLLLGGGVARIRHARLRYSEKERLNEEALRQFEHHKNVSSPTLACLLVDSCV